MASGLPVIAPVGLSIGDTVGILTPGMKNIELRYMVTNLAALNIVAEFEDQPEKENVISRVSLILHGLGFRVKSAKEGFPMFGASERSHPDPIAIATNNYLNAVILLSNRPYSLAQVTEGFIRQFQMTPKILVGCSADSVALLNHITSLAGVVTFMGPSLVPDLDDEKYYQALFQNLIASTTFSGYSFRQHSTLVRRLRAGKAAGRLFGGEFSTLASTLKKPVVPSQTPTILCLQIPNLGGPDTVSVEKVSRILSVYPDIAGLLIMSPQVNENELACLSELLKRFPASIPCLVAANHKYCPALPIGCRVVLDAENERLDFLERPTANTPPRLEVFDNGFEYPRSEASALSTKHRVVFHGANRSGLNFWNVGYQWISCLSAPSLRSFRDEACKIWYSAWISSCCDLLKRRVDGREGLSEASVGGVLGGTKLEDVGTFCKIAENGGIYTSPELARKAISNEYRSICATIHAINSCVREGDKAAAKLRCPMACLIEYKGHRALMLSRVPIDDTTLVLGRSSIDQSIRNVDSEVYELVDAVGRQLNLKSHLISGTSHRFRLPADTEGHRGYDGHIYLVDFGRAFPPEWTESRGYEFSHILRPNFVAGISVPLNPDVLCRNFWRPSSYDNADLGELRTASQILYARCETLALSSIDISAISQTFHDRGLNMRLLGLFYDITTDPVREKLALVEMIRRCVKQRVRDELCSADEQDVDYVGKWLSLTYSSLLVDALRRKYGYFWLTWPASANPTHPLHMPKLRSLSCAQLLPILQDEVQTSHIRAYVESSLGMSRESARARTVFAPKPKPHPPILAPEEINERDIVAADTESYARDPLSFADIEQLVAANSAGSSVSAVAQRFQRYLLKDGCETARYVKLEGDFLEIWTPESVPQLQHRFSLPTTLLSNVSPHTCAIKRRAVSHVAPLRGWKIGLNPTFFAGSLPPALEAQADGVLKFKNEVYYGKLNLHVSIMLRDMLTQLGAEVFLTRENGCLMHFQDFESWCLSPASKKPIQKWMMKASHSFHMVKKDFQALLQQPREFVEKFKTNFLYQLDTNLERAFYMNKMNVDLCITIGFSASSSHIDKGFSVYVPGAFQDVESIKTPRERVDFARLALTDICDVSEDLAECISESALKTGLFTTDYESAISLELASKVRFIQMEKGIMARNLTMTRLCRMPNVYISLLYDVDNPDPRLFEFDEKFHYQVAGRPSVITTSRILREMAKAFCEGVVSFTQARSIRLTQAAT